ncbi:uncharacterized protein PG986_014476 [Apiospora aurea]|uniref:Uncharacterized protein n=1 Tax=Apiospora aurea TaxID=335848 RepID=A0ABR1PT44_9PEZI
MPAGYRARRQRSNEAPKHEFKAVLRVSGVGIRRKDDLEPDAHQFYYRESEWRKDGSAVVDRIVGEVVWISVQDKNRLPFELHGEADAAQTPCTETTDIQSPQFP